MSIDPLPYWAHFPDWVPGKMTAREFYGVALMLMRLYAHPPA